MFWPNIYGSQILSDLEYFHKLELTSWPVFVCCCWCVCVCVCVTKTDRQTYWRGWMSWGRGLSFHQHCVYGGTRTLWPSCELSGGLQRPPEGPEVSIHAHHKQCTAFAHSTERRQSPQAAHMSQHVITLLSVEYSWFFIPFLHFPQKESFMVYFTCIRQMLLQKRYV